MVFIRCDDLARWAVHALGNEDTITPNMDRLFAEGANFSNAFVTTPVCSPSRAATLTGLHSVQHGIPDWITQGDHKSGIRPEYVTWPEALKSAGYETAFFGKWHVGSAPEFHPTKQGFDQFTGMLERAENLSPVLESEGREEKHEGVWRDEYLAAKAAEFIERPHDAPFLTMVDFRSPHAPYLPVPEEDKAKYAGRKLKVTAENDADPKWVGSILREYYSAVTYVDRCVGKVLDALDRSGRADQTLVIFTSDHGYMIGHHGLQHKGNAARIGRQAIADRMKDPEVRRPNMFDDSIRVPLAIRWPRQIKPGTVVDEMVIHQDFYKSILAMAGIDAPTLPPSQKIQGDDFSPLLRGEKVKWRDTIFGDYDMMQGKRARMRMIRTAEWKLVTHEMETGGKNEFYDLIRDPRESRNLYPTDGSNAPEGAPLAELQQRLTEWQMQFD